MSLQGNCTCRLYGPPSLSLSSPHNDPSIFFSCRIVWRKCSPHSRCLWYRSFFVFPSHSASPILCANKGVSRPIEETLYVVPFLKSLELNCIMSTGGAGVVGVGVRGVGRGRSHRKEWRWLHNGRAARNLPFPTLIATRAMDVLGSAPNFQHASS